MTSRWLTSFLWLVIFFSAFAVIYSSFVAREKFVVWQKLIAESQSLEVEWGQLLIEKSRLTSYSRLESIAIDKLKMLAPPTKQIVVVGNGAEQ